MRFLFQNFRIRKKTMADIDWTSINEKLPYQRTEEQKAKRRELFNQFDPNGNGYLSLAEVFHRLTCTI